MRIIRNEKQKDNLAKLFWDMGKIVMAILVLSPLANPEIDTPVMIVGVLIATVSWFLGFIIDGMKLNNI